MPEEQVNRLRDQVSLAFVEGHAEDNYWRCARCGEINSAKRPRCNCCGAEATHWTCIVCEEINRADRMQCNQCGLKQQEDKKSTDAKEAGADKLANKGCTHWTCIVCEEINRADRIQCNQCGLKKPEESKAEDAKEAGADKLANKGFTLKQLLQFYTVFRNEGRIVKGTTTNEVVRNIIIPDTSKPPRCYMEAAFMQPGGGQRANKLVSHAWKSEFVNTVLNIVLDATGMGKKEFSDGEARWGECQVFAPGDGVYNPEARTLEADFLLNTLADAILSKTYWLCIFAVDEHHAICGDCWECNKKDKWIADPIKHLKADQCLLCKSPKFNPCTCGSLKFAPGDPLYEIDLFDRVVRRVDALIVSLDGDLNSIKRVWVVAEIGTAMQISTVNFRLCEGLSGESVGKLEKGSDLMPSVANCEATSTDDKERILSEIRNLDGGIPAYDQFINCMLELSFGVFSRLRRLRGAAAQAAGSLRQLEIDLTWAHSHLQALEDYCSFFKQLRVLSVTCDGCKNLTSIDELGRGLPQCQAFASATFNFAYCSGLTSIDKFGRFLGQCQSLTSVSFNFSECSFTSIDGFGNGLGQSQSLISASFCFMCCDNLISIDGFGKGLGKCPSLSSGKFDFTYCENLASINGLAECHALVFAGFVFERCSSITSIDGLGHKLGQCQLLVSANFTFANCTQLTSIDKLGIGLGQCQVLESARFIFWGCHNISSIDGFGHGLGWCRALASATFDFDTCSALTSIDGFGNGLGRCQALASANFKFFKCEKFKLIDDFGTGLGRCKSLASAEFKFAACSSLSSIDGFGHGLGQCQALVSVTFRLRGCSALTNIDEFARNLGQCLALKSVKFGKDCPAHLLTPIVRAALPISEV